MTKILIVSPSYYPEIKNGGSIKGCHMFARMCNNHFKTHVWSFDTLEDGIRRRLVDRVKVFYFRRYTLFDFLLKNNEWCFSIEYLFYLNKFIKKYDLIYFRSIWNFPSLFGFIFCSMKKKKFIICASGKLEKNAMYRSKLKKNIILFLFSKFIKSSSRIHYSSIFEYQNASVKPFKDIKPLFIPTPVDIPDNKNFNQQNILNFYSVSRIHKTKNLEYAIDEFSKLDINFTYKIFGMGSTNYINSLKTRSHNNKIEICGYKPIKYFDDSYSNSIFIQMSHSEGLSNSILEALARGSLVIVSRGCNLNFLAKKKCLLEVETSTGNLANLIEKIYSGNIDFNEIVFNAKNFIKKNYDINTLSLQLKNDLNRILRIT